MVNVCFVMFFVVLFIDSWSQRKQEREREKERRKEGEEGKRERGKGKGKGKGKGGTVVLGPKIMHETLQRNGANVVVKCLRFSFARVCIEGCSCVCVEGACMCACLCVLATDRTEETTTREREREHNEQIEQREGREGGNNTTLTEVHPRSVFCVYACVCLLTCVSVCSRGCLWVFKGVCVCVLVRLGHRKHRRDRETQTGRRRHEESETTGEDKNTWRPHTNARNITLHFSRKISAMQPKFVKVGLRNIRNSEIISVLSQRLTDTAVRVSIARGRHIVSQKLRGL